MSRPIHFCLALALAAAVTTGSLAQSSDPTVFINEIHYDNTGTDTGEFIEIAGPAGTDLSGYAIVLYNGATGASYDTDGLSGTIPNQQNGFGVVTLPYPSNGIQNGAPDAVALVNNNAVVQFLSYEGTFTATNGPANGLTSTDIGVSENGTEPVGQSLQLKGTGNSYGDFTWAGASPASPGNVNTGQTFDSTTSQPAIAVNDASVSEGDSGTTQAVFTVTLSSGDHQGVTFTIATADGMGPSGATTPGDYASRAETITLPPNTTTYTFEVTVNGDVIFEPDETFSVRLTDVIGATILDGNGIGTITNDDAAPPVTSEVVISQLYGGGGNTGATLTHDFIELFNRSASPVDLTGWSVQYASASGTSWLVTPLTGTIAPGGYFLIQQASGAGGTTPLPTADATGTTNLSGTAGKVALRTTSLAFSGACPATGLVDFIGYGNASCAEGMPAPQLTATTAALRKRGGCFDSDNNSVDFLAAGPAPRNSASSARSCNFMAAAIHEIQGPDLESPFAGQDVITSGIVTGRKSNGFFLQTSDGARDTDPNTSQGIFVFTTSQPVTAVTVGDDVTVRGTVSEFFQLTQVESSLPGDVTVNGSGAMLPSAITLTSAFLNAQGPLTQLEPLEGMRVLAPSLISTAPTDAFGEIATVLPGVTRPMREPGISVLDPVPADPSTGVPDCCIPRFDENPERLFVDTEGLVGMPVVPVTSNVMITNVSGPLDFTFGRYKLLPEVPLVRSGGMTGVPVPPAAADEFTVGSFNIENFAGSESQRRKASLAIRELMRSPDVIGHIEIFDLPTLQGLAAQVNADTSAATGVDPQYEAVLIPAPEGGTQHIGFLVKTSRVQIDHVSQERAGDTFVNPTTGVSENLHDRPPLVLHATVDPHGINPRKVIVVVNHLRSFIGVELLAGEGPRVRAKRKAQAESVAGLLQELQTANPGIAVTSIGDYNAFQFNDGYTDPIATLKGTPTADDTIVVDESADVVEPDFANLTDALPAAERYTFIFEGTPQALDHVLVNGVAASYATRYAIARGNADFPESAVTPVYAGDPTRPERASDHDMPVAYFRFPPPSADVSLVKGADVASVTAGGQVTYTMTVTNNGVSPAQNVVVSDQLPNYVTLTSCTASGDGVCGGTAANPTVTFASLAPGALETITLVATLACAAPNGSSVVNIATATSDTADPDGGNNIASAVVTALNAAPLISGVSASHSWLIPNHQMVPVHVDYAATDSCGAVTTALSVSSNEPVTAPPSEQGAAGKTTPDWVVVDSHLVRLRAERSPHGDDRVYTITITAADEGGGVTREQVTVIVPKQVAAGRP